MTAGGIAGGLAGFISTPLDVVKTWIQTTERKEMKNIRTAVSQIYTKEGIKGFTKGASARMVYFMPSAAITWTTYETSKRLIKKYWGHDHDHDDHDDHDDHHHHKH